MWLERVMRKLRINMKKTAILGILLAGFCAFLGSSQVFAKISEADLVKKAANGGLYDCYHGYLPSWQIIGTGNGATFNNVSNLSTSDNTPVVALPSSTAQNALSCKQFYGGSGGFNGLFRMGYGLSEPGSSDSAKATFLQKVGYESDGGATSKRACIAIKYSVTVMDGGTVRSGPTSYTTNYLCASLDDTGGVDSFDSIQNDGRGTGSDIILSVTNGGEVCAATAVSSNCKSYTIDESWDAIVGKIETLIQNEFQSGDTNGEHTVYRRTGRDTNPGESGNSYVYKYVVNNLSNTYSTATNNIFGGDNRTFNMTDTISLYQHYLNTYADDRACTDDAEAVQTLIANGYSSTKVRLINNGKYYNNCYIKNNNSTMLNGVVNGQIKAGSINIDGIIAFLNSHTPEWIADVLNANIHFPNEENPEDNPNPVPAPGNEESGETSNGDTDDVCYGSEGTLGLSWIVCPIVTALYDALDTTYDVVENNFLKIDSPTLLGDKTRDAWGIFQNVANIIFVLFLLVVIFSQLTGVGIDNYGIKKILPRLIICAILVNLSYFIAQLLVDTSNIVGVSIKNLFESMSAGGNAATGGAVAGEAIGVAGTGILAGVAIATFVANPALLLTLLLSLLTGVISVLMLLAILVGRQVGVVVAVVVAPLAFVMYIFPNTNKWLKSWGNLFKGLLLLYPLAAALVGASAFVADIVANAGGGSEWMALAAMLIRVVPFFFLPTLFRKSLDAVGNLGTRIQGFGRGVGQGLGRTTRNAEWYKNAQELGRERQLTRRAGYNTDGTERNDIFARIRRRADDSAIGRGLGWQRSRRSATEAYIKAQNERQKDEYLRNQDNVSATLLGQEAKWEKEQVENQGVLLDKGMMTSISGGNFSGQDDPESVKNELIKRLSQSPEEQAAHYAENMALWKKLQSFKDKGYDKTAELWDSTEITDSNSRMMQQIKADVAANGDFKNGARTAYDIITGSGGRRAGAVAAARGSGASLANLRMERIPDFSGAELNALSAVAQGQQYVDADGNLQTPSVDRQMQASELLLDALSDSQVRRRFKGADADVARQGAVSAFMNNFDKYTSDKDVEETYVSKNDPSRRFTYKRSQQGFLYDENRRNIIDEDRLSRLTNRVTA